MSRDYYRYFVYGLVVHSTFEMPELMPASSDTPDVIVRAGHIDRHLNMEAYGGSIRLGPELQMLDWAAIGKFDIHGTSEIVVDLNPGVPESLMRVPLLGSVMALLLQLKGSLVLHASAVRLGSTGVGFLGDKMAGKSTTAGAFVSRGYKLLTDDVLPISLDGIAKIAPGFPQMKFTDESSSAISISGSEVMPPIPYPGVEKRQHNVKESFYDEATDVGKLYYLQRGTDPAVEALTVTEQFQILMRFSYSHRFGKASFNTPNGTEIVRQCAKLAEANRVARLVVPDQLARLFEVVPLVETDVNG
ncbi:hypothetical protein AEAC466_21535 [Asticcacaulis sp. AC466]|uniref:hypothetical protein n=1 Tax=Asticcacaulis sp. AC466 TaxID=1282362 RepID=UPI0003C3DDF1|nr:hypothetical protein [Asticcacaulis sp. AC466]ESQ81415.1 hypothetical protein AEAC466_21535 [Asticcacaulis sp. AC466]